MDLLLLRKEKKSVLLSCIFWSGPSDPGNVRARSFFFVAPFVRMRRLVRKLWEDTSNKEEEEKGDRFAIKTRADFVL